MKHTHIHTHTHTQPHTHTHTHRQHTSGYTSREYFVVGQVRGNYCLHRKLLFTQEIIVWIGN
jgi:hypothetical protein